MTGDSTGPQEKFVLDRVENPHPVMRAKALQYRRAGGIEWRVYLECMCDATGCEAEEIEMWLDRTKAEMLRQGPSTLKKSPAKSAAQLKRWNG